MSAISFSKLASEIVKDSITNSDVMMEK